MLFERIDLEVAPLRERYEALMNDPAQIERILLIGAEKARKLSRPFMTELRHAVGLRNLAAGRDKGGARKAAKVAKPSFKQYRERDGLFYFKLLDANGAALLQSRGFASPQEAGRAIAALQQQRGAALAALADQLEPVGTEELSAASAALEALAEATTATSGS